MNYRLLLKIILSLLILVVIFCLLVVLFFLIFRRDNGSFNSLFWSSNSLYKTYSSEKCVSNSKNYKLGETIQNANFFNLLFVVAVGISILIVIFFLIKFLTNPFSYSYENPEQTAYRKQRQILAEEEAKEEAILREKEEAEFNSLNRTDQELFLALKKQKSFF